MCTAALHKPEKCCAACLFYAKNGVRGGCDAWFMNAQGTCFLKLCSAAEWKSGDCHIGTCCWRCWSCC